jgi:hypothetical protein
LPQFTTAIYSFDFFDIALRLIIIMSKPKGKEPIGNIKNLSTEELKVLLNKLEHEHDILEARNE